MSVDQTVMQVFSLTLFFNHERILGQFSPTKTDNWGGASDLAIGFIVDEGIAINPRRLATV